MINIGQKVKELRKDRKITQEKLAEKSGLSINYISRIENKNDLHISISVLIKLADALQISVAELVQGTNNMQRNPDIEQLSYRLSELPTKKASQISQLFIKLLDQLEP